MLGKEWNPAPKPTTKKPNRSKKKKKKHLEHHKGVTIPHRKQRGKVKRQDYNDALREWGEYCTECGNPKIEMHHVVFRSGGGRGGFRNLHPLCKHHHDLAHKSREFADKLRKQHQKRYGNYYHCDKYDLWKAGLIENPTDELFEKFMRGKP